MFPAKVLPTLNAASGTIYGGWVDARPNERSFSQLIGVGDICFPARAAGTARLAKNLKSLVWLVSSCGAGPGFCGHRRLPFAPENRVSVFFF